MVRNYIRRTEDRWSKEDLLAALIELKDRKIKIRDATKKYGISRATLYRNLEKFIASGATLDVEQFKGCGGNPILTRVEEAVLEKTIKDLREQGYNITGVDVKRICFEYCVANGIPNRFNEEKRMASDDWYYGFCKRHPDVAVVKKIAVGGRFRGKFENKETESGSEAILEAATNPKSKGSGSSSQKNARRVSTASSPVKNTANKEQLKMSPKLVAPDGVKVAKRKRNAAKRLKLETDASQTESVGIRRSRRSRSTATVDEDNEKEDKLVDATVTVGKDGEEVDQEEEIGVEMDTNDSEQVDVEN